MAHRSVCKYWKPHERGGCHNGDKCPYKHEEPLSYPCRDFAAGYCPLGDHCRYSHERPHRHHHKHHSHQHSAPDPSENQNHSHQGEPYPVPGAYPVAGHSEDAHPSQYPMPVPSQHDSHQPGEYPVPGHAGTEPCPAALESVDRVESGLIKDNQLRQAAKRLMKFFDRDGSGKVTVQDVQERVDEVNKHTGRVQVPAAAGEKVVSVLDEDGNGQLDEEEVYDGMKKVANVVNAVGKMFGHKKKSEY